MDLVDRQYLSRRRSQHYHSNIPYRLILIREGLITVRVIESGAQGKAFAGESLKMPIGAQTSTYDMHQCPLNQQSKDHAEILSESQKRLRPLVSGKYCPDRQKVRMLLLAGRLSVDLLVCDLW